MYILQEEIFRSKKSVNNPPVFEREDLRNGRFEDCTYVCVQWLEDHRCENDARSKEERVSWLNRSIKVGWKVTRPGGGVNEAHRKTFALKNTPSREL